MPKHKKFLKSEKAKVKLKGAKLPKGLNVTKTDFKIKKIVIRDQAVELLEDGTKKQNIKELVTKIKHHNLSIRMQSLKTLKEFVATNSEVAVQNLGLLLQAVASLCIDIERDSRQESFRVLDTIFRATSSSIVKPFFSTIISFLRCAMTHIQQGIQEDSLLFLDTLIIHLPELVAENNDKIFTNFLNIISRLRSEANPSRMLSVNVSNKITSVKWRNRILERLQEILKILVDHKLKSTNSTITRERKRKFNINGENFISLTRNNLNGNFNLFSYGIGGQTKTTMFNENKEMDIKEYSEQLIPLLFESWMEVRPRDKSAMTKHHSVALSNEARHSLNVILMVLRRIWSLVEVTDKEKQYEISVWFRTTYEKDFNNYLFTGFPYQAIGEVKGAKRKKAGAKKNKDDEIDSFCLEENLLLIYLFCVFNVPLEHGDVTKKQVESVLQFLMGCFTHLNEKTQLPLDEVLRIILYANGKEFLDINQKSTKDLLSKTLELYAGQTVAGSIQKNIFTLLCDIVLDPQLYKIYGEDEFESWLKTLPEKLCQPHVAKQFLVTLTTLAKRRNLYLHESLKNNINRIVDNLPLIRVSGVTGDEGRHMIINLFFWIEDWSSLDKDALLKQTENWTNTKLSSYLKFIVDESQKIIKS